MSTSFNLDLLSIFPRNLTEADNEIACQTLHALMLENHSPTAIAQIAKDHAVDHQEQIQALSKQALAPSDDNGYASLTRLRALSLLRSPLYMADFIMYADHQRLKFLTHEVPRDVYAHHPGATSLVCSSGLMVPAQSINYLCQNKSMIQFLMLMAIRADDPDLLQYLLKVPKIAKVFDPGKIPIWLSEMSSLLCENSLHSESALRARYLATNGFMPKSYSHYVDEMLGLSKLRYDNTQVPSLPEFAQKVGHEVIRELMEKDSKAVMRVMKQLIQDGADWYIAFEQKKSGSCAYFDLVGRTPDSTAELAAVMFGAKNNGCKPLGQALIQALGKEPFIKLSYDQKSADKLWREWRLPFVVDRVSERYREEILGSDLGL